MLTEQQRKDFNWYKGALADLYEKYGNCRAVISGARVLGTYPTFGDACRAADELCEPGSYIVQEIGLDESAFAYAFASMWVECQKVSSPF